MLFKRVTANWFYHPRRRRGGERVFDQSSKCSQRGWAKGGRRGRSRVLMFRGALLGRRKRKKGEGEALPCLGPAAGGKKYYRGGGGVSVCSFAGSSQ